MASVTSDDTTSELPPFPVRKWTVEEYERFGQLGILDEDDQLELLDGWIVPKKTKNPRHDATVDQINQHLGALMPTGWYVRAQNVLLTSDSAPEPDVVVVKGVPRDYRHRHPTAKDVALVVEVADSSIDRDRLKSRIYARAGVPVYWIVNLSDNSIEVLTAPAVTGRNAAYDNKVIVQTGNGISFDVPDVGKIDLEVADLFP
jgi:Uma2 family endonuclease